MSVTVNYWETSSGRRPVEEFINDQRSEPKLQDKLLRQIDKLEKFGTADINGKDLSPLGGGIFELRVIFKSNYYRILFGLKRECIWLLLAFHKKTNKTPKDKFDLAKERLKDV